MAKGHFLKLLCKHLQDETDIAHLYSRLNHHVSATSQALTTAKVHTHLLYTHIAMWVALNDWCRAHARRPQDMTHTYADYVQLLCNRAREWFSCW